MSNNNKEGIPDRMHDVCTGLFHRYEELGEIQHLKEAIEWSQDLFYVYPHHPFALRNIGRAMAYRFAQFGSIEDLELAIKYHHEALTLFLDDHPLRSSALIDLFDALFTRFEHLGRKDDLEAAITWIRQALPLDPCGPPLNRLSRALNTRFELSRRTEDLEEVIAKNREALARCPHGPRHHRLALDDLGCTLSMRFEHSGCIEDLEEAITHHREALALLPHGNSLRPALLSNLGIAMFIRFRRLRNKGDQLDALKYLSEAATTTPTDHPGHMTTGFNLANIYLELCESFLESDGRLSLLRSFAFDLFKELVNHSFASAKSRFQVALRWAQAAHSQKHQSTVEAYAKALSLLDRCLVLTPTIESKQNFLATMVPRALALDAASSAIDAGELETAVELLEQGRAVLWSKLRGYRHPLDELRAIDKELANLFKTLCDLLEHRATSSDESVDHFRATQTYLEGRLQCGLSGGWDRMVEEIRQIDGFADFLQAVPFATLQKAAAEGPVIMVNISTYRPDAIILRAIGGPVLVPLAEASPHVLKQLSSQLAKARASDGSDSARQILPILRSLWAIIAVPVREQLVALGVPDKSRIWWCPTSDLCSLPLHAAGAYSAMVAKPNALPDCYISSYTPTLSALIRARAGVPSMFTYPNLLVVAQPDDTLPEVEKEISHIQRVAMRQFANKVYVLKGPAATHDSVLSYLKHYSWAHFACHGHLNEQPFRSSFQLHNHKRLELVDLIRAELPNAELAFLSACHTAAGDLVGTPDEVIHLAAALQFCGFRSVVGTLWAMEDVDGCDVAEYFYQHMFRTARAIPNFKDSAEALNRATMEMRRRGLGLDRWTKFVHIGA